MALTDRQQHTLAWVVGGLIFAALGAGLIYQAQKPRPNRDTLCVGQSDRSTVIVLDWTDHVSVQTQNEIVSRVTATVRDEVAAGENVAVFTVDDLSRRSLAPKFDKCKPDVTGSALTQNTTAIRQQAKRQFDDELLKVLRAPVTSAAQSPIAEAIIDLSQTRYLRAVTSNRLMVFSDLIQNTAQASVLSCVDGQTLIENFSRSQAAGTPRPSFKQVDVRLNVVPRSGLNQAGVDCRTRFWNWFFGDNSGPDARLMYLPLPGPIGG